METMLALALLLAGSAALAEPETPKTTFTVSAACGDVYREVYEDVDPSWVVNVLPASPEQKLPTPEQVEAFLVAVPGLEKATARLDVMEIDLFVASVESQPLEKLARHYPGIAPAMLRAAKVQACRDAATR